MKKIKIKDIRKRHIVLTLIIFFLAIILSSYVSIALKNDIKNGV